jgi:hypothetical protein
MTRSTPAWVAASVAALCSAPLLLGRSSAEPPPQAGLADGSRAALVTHLRSKLTTNDPDEHDCFGRSLAMDGQRLIAGAKGDDENGSNAGAAYVFRRDASGDWVQEAKLKASDGRVNDFFGFSVDIDDEKGIAVVGAWQSSAKAQGAGSAYVFRRQGEAWTQEARLNAADATAFAQFGYAISLSGDTVVIGARADDDRAADAGSAYVFVNGARGWVQQAKLTAPAAAPQDQFGWSVALDGNTLVVGALGDDEGARDAGAAYVFTRTVGTWTRQAKLVARGARPYDNFGYSVALSGDRAVVGAYGDDTGGADSGAAYVFERTGARWGEVQKLTASDSIPNEWFGWSVALAGDTVVVGAWYDTHASQPEGPLGSAYLFQKDGGRWTERTKLMAQNGRALDLFGWTVAVSGRTVAVGARLDDTAAAEGGAVYIHGL